MMITRFERASLIGERVWQLARGATPACDVSDLEDEFQIAEREVTLQVIPIQIKRGQAVLNIARFKWTDTKFS